MLKRFYDSAIPVSVAFFKGKLEMFQSQVVAGSVCNDSCFRELRVIIAIGSFIKSWSNSLSKLL